MKNMIFMVVVFYALGLLYATPALGQAAATDVNCDGCVHSGDIATNGVRRADIQPFAINTPKLNNFAVTTEKIKTGAVTESKIANGAVTGNKIAPELANYVDSAIGGLILEQFWESNGSGVVGSSCPADTLVGSTGCDCSSAGGTRNYGVVFTCAVSGNGGVGGCFNEAATFNPGLPAPLATIILVCVSAVQLDGTPIQPEPLSAGQPQQLSAKQLQTRLSAAATNGSGVDLETAVYEAREALAAQTAALQNR